MLPPGHEIVDPGLADLRAGRWTAEAYAVLEARPRLERAGVAVPDVRVERPSHRLYELLAEEDVATAHGRHHAILRRMASYCRTVESAARR
ncbi:MAG: hypothetical protein H0V81_02405 [Solirubrobacterales bacterium]|nr:hypothetical protein [Solirubrobacterales bacterium]